MNEPQVEESLVLFQAGQDAELRGKPLRMTRFAAAFELYGDEDRLRLSEALHCFRIMVRGRTIYAGRAVMRSLIETGPLLVCEVALDESAWRDLEFDAATARDGWFRDKFNDLLSEWQKVYRILPEFKVALADLQSFLTNLRLWLEQAELSLSALPPPERVRHEADAARELAPAVVPAIASLFERFEHVARRVETDAVPAHRVFGKQQLHPLLLCSPFVRRTYVKPLGYAGDYEMVNMMFRDPFEGGSLFAKMINAYALQLPPISGHRNRIGLLAAMLSSEAARVARQRRSLRVFTLGCGPAQEVQRFLADSILANGAEFVLADFNDETLNYTRAVLEGIKRQHGRQTRLELVKSSAHQLIKNADKPVGLNSAGHCFDVVYCAGLFDYLSDKLCRRLMEVFYAMLVPDGLLLATNVDNHPARQEMECFLDWHLVHRNTAQMRALAPSAAPADDVVIKRDDSGVNVFLEIRKPGHEN